MKWKIVDSESLIKDIRKTIKSAQDEHIKRDKRIEIPTKPELLTKQTE